IALLTNGNVWVIYALKSHTEIKGNETTRHQLNIASAKNPVEYRAHIQFRNQASSTYGTFAIQAPGFSLPVAFQHLPILIGFEFLKRHGCYRPVVQVAYFFINGIIQTAVE